MKENYLIVHKDGGFLGFDDSGQWTRRTSIKKAVIFEKEKANNVFFNSISPALRKNWSIVSTNEYKETFEFFNETPFDENGIDWKTLVENQTNLYKDLLQYKTNLCIKLSEVDKEICDIEHYMEFFSLDAAKGYKAYKMLHERRVKRRFFKDELSKLNIILNSSCTEYADEMIRKQIGGMNARKYEPRVLRELFDITA